MAVEDDDKFLVIQIREGNSKAFETLYHRYNKMVFYFAIRYFNSVEDAENVVQDVFVKIWKERARLMEDLSFSNYIFTITKNHLFNINRKKINEKKFRAYFVHHFTESGNLENEVLYADIREKIDKAIEELPEQRRKVFHLGNIKGYTNKEVAEELHLSVRTVEAHKNLALKSLRKFIDGLMLWLLLFTLTDNMIKMLTIIL